MHRPETQLRIGLLKEGRFTPGPHRIREGCGFESEAIHTRPLIFTLFMRAGLPGNVCVECVEETCLKLEARRAFFFGMLVWYAFFGMFVLVVFPFLGFR